MIGAVLAAFIVLALAEAFWPARDLQAPIRGRWKINGGLYFISLLIMVSAPLSSFGAALYANHGGFGLFLWTGWMDGWGSVLAALLLLDFSKYLLHLVMHHVPALWRIHKVHHADPDMDLSTAVRFHPLETVVTLAWNVGVALLLGPPIIAALIHEVSIAVCAFFEHANLYISRPLESRLRWIVVTPQMHSVHHSVDLQEGNHNFGGLFSLWDRLFRTYLAVPKLGLRGMRFGLAGVAADSGLPALVKLPFRRG